jgi:hypothetical protein
MSAEMAARRTAAAAALADFRRESDAFGVDGALVYRLAAELGSVLDQLEAEDAPVLVLTAGNEAVLEQALADAVAYRYPAGACPLCDQHPAGLCEDHADDLDRTDAYLALARDLGLEMDR